KGTAQLTNSGTVAVRINVEEMGGLFGVLIQSMQDTSNFTNRGLVDAFDLSGNSFEAAALTISSLAAGATVDNYGTLFAAVRSEGHGGASLTIYGGAGTITNHAGGRMAGAIYLQGETSADHRQTLINNGTIYLNNNASLSGVE